MNNKLSDWIKAYFVTFIMFSLVLNASNNDLIVYISLAIITLIACCIGYIFFSLINYIDSK